MLQAACVIREEDGGETQSCVVFDRSIVVVRIDG